MSERATPETDANAYASWKYYEDPECVDATFARKLERERDEAREELADYKASAERARDVITQAFLRVAKERDEARELARELRDVLERVIDNGHTRWCLFLNYANGKCDCGVDDASAIINKAKEVLP